MKKVYITGMGAISSLGLGVNQSFNALLENQTGVIKMPEWIEYNGLHTHLGAPCPDYDISKLPRTARRSMSRMSEMATLATLEAMEEAKLNLGDYVHSPKVVLCLGSTSGSPVALEAHFKKLFENHGPKGQLGTTFFKVMNHSVPANVANAINFFGPLLSPSSACATSAQSMILGWELIQTGLYDIVIAGGADELHHTSASVFDIVHAASRTYNDRPNETPRPFDKNRDGLVVSEGAAVVILESEESVKRRQAKKLAEFRGGMYSCDGTHMSQSQMKSMIATMRGALERAGLSSADVQYVSAHATGTAQGDEQEAKAIGEVFGNTVPVSSLKGHFGHSLAACGALEAIMSVKMLQEQVLLPTRNLSDIDPECGTIKHVTEKKSTRLETILSNNFAFGGIDSSLILSKVHE
jgi:3-oxoacyl-[acyl-carrier-protein] synthase II